MREIVIPFPFFHPVYSLGGSKSEVKRDVWCPGTRLSVEADGHETIPEAYIAHGFGKAIYTELKTIVPGVGFKERTIYSLTWEDPENCRMGNPRKLFMISSQAFGRKIKGYSRPFSIQLSDKGWGQVSPPTGKVTDWSYGIDHDEPYWQAGPLTYSDVKSMPIRGYDNIIWNRETLKLEFK